MDNFYHLSDTQFVNADDCQWTVNGFDFDISGLEGQTIKFNDSMGFVYSYTPCKNDLNCGAAEKDYMAIQTKSSNCHELSSYNSSVVPKYDSSDGSYNLHYTGGESGRKFTAKYICGDRAYNATSCTESSGTLEYAMTIKSEYACNGHNGGNNSSNSTSKWSWVKNVSLLLSL